MTAVVKDLISKTVLVLSTGPIDDVMSIITKCLEDLGLLTKDQ